MLKRVGENIIKILDKNTFKELIIKTPIIKIPFGIEDESYFYRKKKVENIILKINLNEEVFYKFIQEIENRLFNMQKKLDNKEYELNSQIII